MKNIFLILAVFACLAISAQAQSDIRKVDFKNFTYEPLCAGGETEKVTVKNGEISAERKIDGEYTERFYFEVFHIAYGDVDGDKNDEAVILSVCNTGGTGQFTEGFVYTLKNGKPSLLARIEGGDRGFGGLLSAKVEKGLLVVESNDAGNFGANCCADFIETIKYRWNGENLVQEGKPSWREKEPSERISFKSGASKSVFNLNLPKGESKRYIIRAKAGQRLLVSTNANQAKSVSYRLVHGEADINEYELNRLYAILRENDDYVFELTNDSNKNLNLLVTVEIH